jgi:cysteinyl-tRNA synthetase
MEITGVLGIDLSEQEEGIPSEITELVEQRAAAKKTKDFAEADRIRDLITSKGYSVKDTPQGPQVEKL